MAMNDEVGWGYLGCEGLCTATSNPQSGSGILPSTQALAHQSWPSLVPSFGWALTKHFLTGSTPAQRPLTLHRHSSVLTSSAHLVLRLHSKCCSDCSPSRQPWWIPVLGTYHYWIPAPCPCLRSHESNHLHLILRWLNADRGLWACTWLASGLI
jgi:hypothetical protein